jgi:2-hydroxy-4-carboxymuconate semialdehyde hemiacetal dehydrogenase
MPARHSRRQCGERSAAIDIAIIGSGSIAEDHAAALLALAGTPAGRGLRLSAVVGRRPEEATAFAARFGIARHGVDLDAALGEPAIDAVVICSPTDLHAAQAEAALRSGKHVLCEIPLATSLAETDRLIALADAAGKRLMVCHTQRFFPPLVEARRRIAAGALHPTAIVSRYLFDRRDTINWKGRTRSWTDNLLWHHGGHAVDAALWLLGVGSGEEVSVAAQIADPDPVLGTPMNLSLAMRTSSGQIATVAMSYHARLPAHDYLIIGEETTLLFAGNALVGTEGAIVPASGPDPLGVALPAQDAEFLAALREDREPAISARAIRPAMAALQAAEDQARSRSDLD